MFNDLRVSNSISGQVPSYFAQEYPNFVNFLKDYYRFLETNGNSLDLLNGIQDLIDIETYTGVDYSSQLSESITSDDVEVIVNGHVKYPLTNGLLKIDDEIIFYKLLSFDIVNGNKVTKFTDCIRGYTYNTLTIEEGFTSNIKTTPDSHSANVKVENQSYVYLLYFLEQLREQYLSEFPKGILAQNLEKGLNVDNILKRIKDFYLTKGTPKGIEFYFKFLFQKNSEIRNYRDSIFTPSDATYEDKTVVRLENLDSYPASDLILKKFIQSGKEFTIFSYENLYSNNSLSLEYEISDPTKLLPTKVAKIISRPDINKGYLYVDSTEGFPKSGTLKYRNIFINYISKKTNYFICDNSIQSLNIIFNDNLDNTIGKLVYDVETLCVLKDIPDFYFSVYSGIVDTNTTKNIGYVPGDIGTVTNISLDDDPVLTSWSYNNVLPARKNNGLLSSVTNLYYNDESAFVNISKVPFSQYPGNNSPLIPEIELNGGKRILLNDRYVKIPRKFTQRNFKNRESTLRQFPVGLLIDGTPLFNWKSNDIITLGKIDTIDIQNGGSNFNVSSPPSVKIDAPSTTETDKQTAQVELKINGHIEEVNIEDSGSGYPENSFITIKKSDNNDPNIKFRQALVSLIVVGGKITKVRIIDPGTGYTAPPTIEIFPDLSSSANPAIITAVTEGSIYKVNYILDDNNEPIQGKKYTENPTHQLQKGIGATAIVNIKNGRLHSVSLINSGQGYNSPPKINIIDKSGSGLGAKVISKIDSNKSVNEFVIINPGINYNEDTTVVEIIESGGGEVINFNTQTWTPNNNYRLSSHINDDGSYLEPIQESSNTVTYNILGAPTNLKYHNKNDNTYQNINFEETLNLQHSPIIGWAFDGSPIYGPFGYRESLNSGSDVVRMTSGYRKKLDFEDIRDQTGGINLGNFEIGYFEEDWEWFPDPKNLDQQNGRFCVTPEFPEGVYAYFSTINTSNGIDKNKGGFPYFIGSKYRGITFNDFNTKEISTLLEENLTKYVSQYDTTSIKPVDPGIFLVESIPESTDSKLSSIQVTSGGNLYKVGDQVVFDNTLTKGFGASAYVSILKGSNVTNTAKQPYDYVEYEKESSNINQNTIFKTIDGYQGSVFNVDPIKKQLYILRSSGSTSIINKNSEIFDDQNLSDTTIVSKLTENINTNLITTTLNGDVNNIESLITVSNSSNITVGDYLKIDQEYLKVIEKDSLDLRVIRGVGFTKKEKHDNTSQIKILTFIKIFSSSEFIIGDIVKIDSELFKIVDISVDRESSIQGINIINSGSGIAAGTYYLYFDGVLQLNGGANNTTVTVANGEVTSLTFDPDTSISDNPNIQIGDSATYSSANFLDVDIRGSRFSNTIAVERAVFNTIAATHVSGVNAIKQSFTNAIVKKFDSDRILTTIGAPNNLLSSGDEVSISASLESVINKTITKDSNDVIKIDNTDVSTLDLYEGYSYIFDTIDLRVDFFGIFVDDNNDFVPGRKYFDIDVEEKFDGNELDEFTINPKASDLTQYFLVLSDPNDLTITKNILINTISEPINGEYSILRSSTNDFTIYTEVDPGDNFISNYNSTNLSYSTNSSTAKGPISFVTLTSGGFSYITPPGITKITSTEGVGAILSPKTNSIGVINKIQNKFSGYGFTSDFRQKPNIQFPQILQISNIFTVTSANLNSGGENYLFTPRIIVTGGGLADNDTSHAVISSKFARTGNRSIISLNVESKGKGYSSAPNIIIEKYYFIELSGENADTVLSFKFPFSQYILQDDKFKVRGYYINDNGDEVFADSGTYLANLTASGITCRLAGSNDNLDPRDTGDLNNVPSSTPIQRWEFISESRVAIATAIITKSTFKSSEKIIFNEDENKFGFVTSSVGWQSSNSTLRVEKFNYQFKIGDTLFGENSKSFGKITSIEGSTSEGKLGVSITKPKDFLTKKSFLGSNFEKIQDSFKYQKFSYEIGVDTPFSVWKENYKEVVHPTGYNLFARAKIENNVRIGDPEIQVENISTISTNIAQEISLRRKYNYLVTRNIGNEEVEILNKKLTDVKETSEAVVAVFEDISNQFNDINTSFLLKAVDPLEPRKNDEINYIEDYDVDQMLVILDNVIQTYGTTWFVTDSDKNIQFTPSQQQGELLPDQELLTYRKFNDASIIHNYSESIQSAGSTFNIRDNSGNPWPSSIFTTIDQDNYFVFIDGICQNNSSFTISNTNNGQIDFGSDILPIGTQLSVRYISGFLKNEFTSGSVTANTPITLSNKPSISTFKDNYFVFVDGVLMTSGTDFIYDVNTNKDIIFTISFDYDSLIVIIDPLGVSLNTQENNLSAEQYFYKIEDGQLDIPVGTIINPEEYILDIAGVVQTPYLAYNIKTSGERKINFTEPPRRLLAEENNPNIDTDDVYVGKQFIGLLYQRSDPTGSGGTTKNYQFDDISQNIIHIKENLDNFNIGDTISRDDAASFALIRGKNSTITKVISQSSIVNASFAPTNTEIITINSLKNIFVGDRLAFNGGIGLTSSDDDELEITSIDYVNSTITVQNISSNTLSLNIPIDGVFDIKHNTLEIFDIETTVTNKDNSFVSGSIILSGANNIQSTSITSNVDNSIGLRLDTGIGEIQVSNVSGGALTGNANIVNGGSLYSTTPNVNIVGGSGSGATATATIAGGIITQIALSGGTGYDSSNLPTLVIDGPPASILEVPAGDGAQFSLNDYILINESEIVKVTNISTDTLTVDRGQLQTQINNFFINTTNIKKVIPYQITVNSFRRGFDGIKTQFKLTENFQPTNIPANSDIFVIVNGVRQKLTDSYSLSQSTPNETEINFTEAPKYGSPCNIFYLGQTIPIQNISGQFNGTKKVFELRDNLGEIFSFNAKGKPEANISANLIIFIDGVYQIPSVKFTDREPAYSENLSSFRLFGSILEFNTPPAFGSSFEGFIYVGSDDDYDNIDIDPSVETGDTIIQSNERSSRDVINIISSTTLAVTDSLGQIEETNGINFRPNPIVANGYQFTDLIQSEPVRESLRARRLLSSAIATGGLTGFPLTGRVASTSSYNIEIEPIDDFIPASPDSGLDEFTFKLNASSNFPVRLLNSKYTTAVFGATASDNETLQNVTIGYDLPFNNIIHLSTGSPTIFDNYSNTENGNTISSPIIKEIKTITYGPTTYQEFKADVLRWEPDSDNIGGKLYLKLDDTNNPPLTTHKIRIETIGTALPYKNNKRYAKNELTSANGNIYITVNGRDGSIGQDGTSSESGTGPSGTGNGIQDGTVEFNYVQTIPVNTFDIDDDDLISEYQTLSVGDLFYYTT